MHTLKGEIYMKLLKIENMKGYFIKDKEYKIIDEVSKEDIIQLLRNIYENENIELDCIDESSNMDISMPSQKIIYEKMYEKFNELIEKKEELILSVKSEFKDSYEKYSK